MHTTRFKNNWNKKLDCKFFTTIRHHNPKVTEGTETQVILNEKPIFNSEITKIITTEFGKIPPYFISLDTGYSYDDSLEIFRRFMKCATIPELKRKLVDIQVHKHI